MDQSPPDPALTAIINPPGEDCPPPMCHALLLRKPFAPLSSLRALGTAWILTTALSVIIQRRKGGSEKLSHLPKATQLEVLGRSLTGKVC